MRILKLDGLRGFFCLMVVFLHYPKEYISSWFYDFFLIREAYTFVDFFFILSGFVISLNYENINSKTYLFDFLKKRFIRLYPLVFFSVLVFFIFEIISNIFFQRLINTPENLMSLIMKTFNSLLLINSTPLTIGYGWMNDPTWSVSSEFISYILFGITCLILKIQKRWYIAILLIITSIYILFKSGDFFTFSDYSFLRGFVGFFSGFVVWKLHSSNKNNFPEIILLVSLIIVLYTLNNITGSTKLIFGMISIPLFFSSFLYLLLNSSGFLSDVLESKVFQFLGKISYSIYLNHFIFLLVIPRFIFKFFGLLNSTLNQFFVLIFTVCFIIFYSKMTYEVIEKKLGRLLKNIILKN